MDLLLLPCQQQVCHVILGHPPIGVFPSIKIPTTWCKWRPPQRGYVAINCDGSYQPLRMCAGFGVILRDCCGQVIMAKANHHREDVGPEIAHRVVVLMQEMLAIRDGLLLAIGLHGCWRVEIQSDSKNAISMIHGEARCPRECLDVLREIQELAECGHFEEVYFRFVYRESNEAADFLSKFLRHEDEKLYLHSDELPEDLKKIVRNDVYGPPVVRKQKKIGLRCY